MHVRNHSLFRKCFRLSNVEHSQQTFRNLPNMRGVDRGVSRCIAKTGALTIRRSADEFWPIASDSDLKTHATCNDFILSLAVSSTSVCVTFMDGLLSIAMVEEHTQNYLVV